MQYLLFILTSFFLINPIFACIDDEEVELWGECYNINSTFSLMLENSGLTGNIPDEIGELVYLYELDLSNNSLSGNIPSTIGNLQNLHFLDLMHNQLSGPIPSEIGNLYNLLVLWLGDNQFSGSIPSEIGNLINLREFSVWGNNFNGSIPLEFWNLVNLEYIFLNRNNLEGDISPEIGNLYNLRWLEIWDNQLSGPILSYITNLNQLELLEIDQNNFSGTIPTEISNLTNLNALWLSENQFSGEIPFQIGNLPNLTTLALGDNQFTGDIPQTICNLNLNTIWDNYDITQLMFDENQFCPPYPECIEDYINISNQEISNCFLCDGSDNNEIGLWGNCYHTEYTTEISLPNSNLTGSIPQELENFNNLNYLNLSVNGLTGEIPEFICEIDNYALGNNFFCGPFTNCLDNDGIYPQNNWSECENYCNNNNESNLLGYCYNIEETIEINLSNQALEGNINSEIGQLINLEKLFLNDNQLSGSIPSEIGNLVNLERLYLNDNQLSGSIPSSIQNLINLERLYLNNNQFSEEIPSEINGLISLERLQLQNNLLSGLVSETICELNIEFDSSSRFNISNNSLCPPYPNCIDNYVGEQDTQECNELSSDFDIIEFRLSDPYPNPFNPTTTIQYNIQNFSKININIYNVNGQLIEVLTNKMHQPGSYSINWNAQEYTSGVYFVKLVSKDFTATQKIILIK
tara:strand:- start:3925 stop:5997 length:2073 start_codon:yes stop_codon:yes gene_type:complete